MSMHLVTGFAGAEHITAADQGAFNAAFFGTGQYVMEAGSMCEASITSNNNVRILDGDILMKGRHIRVNPNTYEDVPIVTGTAGVNRNDLIVVEYREDTSTGIETVAMKVIMGTETSGTASDPVYTDGDILGGATFNQMPLYRVVLEGVVLQRIEPMFETILNYKSLAEKYEREFVASCESHLGALNVLDTMEEVEANTEEQQLAGALAVKEVIEEVNNKFDFVDISENLLVLDAIGANITQVIARKRNKQVSISFRADFTNSLALGYAVKINKPEYCPAVITAITVIGVDITNATVYHEASGFVLQDGRIYFRSDSASPCNLAYYNLQYEIL